MFGLEFADREAVLASLGEPARAGITLDPASSLRPETATHVFVEGENLAALRLLRAAYSGRVQLVYIDPPYNTGHDFVYRDRYGETRREHLVRTGQIDADGSQGRLHSAWLAMMYPRLWLARQLLCDDGLFMCSIDDREVHHLRMLLDEIFGEDAFVAQVVVVTNRGGRDYLRIARGHEYLLVYGAGPRARVRELPRDGTGERSYTDARGSYELRELRNRNPKFHPGNRPNLFYPVFVRPSADPEATCPVSLAPRPGYDVALEPRNALGEGSVWRWARETLAAAIVPDDPEASEVVARRVRSGGHRLFEKLRKHTTRPRALWDEPEFRSECGTHELGRLLGAPVFEHPKPVAMLRRCLQIGADPDGLVLDFFAGSGTLQQAVCEENAADGGSRRCVSVQMPEPTPTGSVARARGFETIAAIARARLHACMGAEGLRWFRLQDEVGRVGAGDVTGTDGDVTRLQAFEHERGAAPPDPWTSAVLHGMPLDARILRNDGWLVLHDPTGDRFLAVQTHAHVEDAPELPPGSVIVASDAWLASAPATRMSRLHRLATR